MMTVEYFMDTCTEWEIGDVADCIPFVDRNLWESQRLNAYVTAQVFNKKKLTLTDIMMFDWEKEIPTENDIEISNEEIERLKQMASQWEK